MKLAKLMITLCVAGLTFSACSLSYEESPKHQARTNSACGVEVAPISYWIKNGCHVKEGGVVVNSSVQ